MVLATISLKKPPSQFSSLELADCVTTRLAISCSEFLAQSADICAIASTSFSGLMRHASKKFAILGLSELSDLSTKIRNNSMGIILAFWISLKTLYKSLFKLARNFIGMHLLGS